MAGKRKRSDKKESKSHSKKAKTQVQGGAARAGFVRNSNAKASRVEKKVVDVVSASYPVENTGTQLALLNGCAPGTNNYNRIGRKITMKTLQIRGRIGPTDATDTIPSKVRMLVVYDKQANGVAPTYSNIVTSQNITGATSSTVEDMINLDNRDRFEIIRDMNFEIGGITSTIDQTWASGEPIKVVNEYIRLNDREVIYNAGTAGTVGDITSGSLYVFFIGSQANAIGATFTGAFRLRFTDL